MAAGQEEGSDPTMNTTLAAEAKDGARWRWTVLATGTAFAAVLAHFVMTGLVGG